MPSLDELIDLAEKYSQELPAKPAAIKPPKGAEIAGLDRAHIAQTRGNRRTGKEIVPGGG